jgi:hypothetical protein
LPDGRVLVVGGLSVALREGGLFPTQATSAEIYDPNLNRWSMTAPMGVSRLGHTATRLPDGRVLVAGGEDGSVTVLNSTEIYDPTQDRWISAAPMAVGRFGHLATPMANGDVLVAAGLGEAPNRLNISLTSAEIYDPGTNLWVTVASMGEEHVADTATLLRNGMVLVVGATGQSRPEIYDLAQNRWVRAGPSMDRYQHSATRLADGRVLIVGGYGVESLGAAIIYDPQGVAPAPVRPPDPRVMAALALAALLLFAGAAMSIPRVRQGLKRWRPRRDSEEWIV